MLYYARQKWQIMRMSVTRERAKQDMRKAEKGKSERKILEKESFHGHLEIWIVLSSFFDEWKFRIIERIIGP